MAISDITIYQDNVVGNSNLMPVHSPLVFLVDVTYSGARPDFIYCDVYDEDDNLLGTFKCIPYQDITLLVRRFAFVADEILRGYMNEYDEFVQSEYSLTYVDDITEIFKLTFRDPDGVASDDDIEIIALHGANQFGDNPNQESIYNNDTQTYYAAENKPVYVYFFNDDITNIITVEDASFEEVIAQDYVNDDFTDAVGNKYLINVIS